MFSNAKKSDLGDTIYYLHSHLKNTVKLHITVFSEVTEYKTLTLICMFHIFTEYALCNSNLFTALCKRKNTPLFTTNINSLWVELCTTVHNIAVHIGTEHTTYIVL